MSTYHGWRYWYSLISTVGQSVPERVYRLVEVLTVFWSAIPTKRATIPPTSKTKPSVKICPWSLINPHAAVDKMTPTTKALIPAIMTFDPKLILGNFQHIPRISNCTITRWAL
jgi:hypothetical protein